MSAIVYTQAGSDQRYPFGKVALDSFTGGSDDANLALAMTYAAAQTHPPIIMLSNKSYAFTTARTLYSGFRLMGALQGISNSELGDVNMATKVTLSTTGTWLNVSGGDVFDGYIGGFTVIGGPSTGFLGSDGSSIWHCCHIRDMSFHQIKTILGTQSTKFLMTASLIDGWWQAQGTYNGGVHIGGSDNRLWMNGGLVDTTPAYITAGSSAGQSHFWFDGLDNSDIGPLYVTVQSSYGGIRVTGSAYNAAGPPSNLGMVSMRGIVVEGLNAGAGAADGSVIRVEGGIVKIRDAYLGRCMDNPTTPGHTPTDAGAIHVTGGALLLDGGTYDKASSIAESVPYVYNNGGLVKVFNTFVGSKGGQWVGLPQVATVSGTTWLDESVTSVKTGGTVKQLQTVAL